MIQGDTLDPKEKARLKAKRYYHEHKNDPGFKERAKEISKRFRSSLTEEEKAAERERKRLYKLNNPTKFASYERKRRALKSAVAHSPYTEKEVIEAYGSHCHICGDVINLDAPRKTGSEGWETGLHIDHLIAICNGGADTLENVRPSHGLCNTRKNKYEVLEGANI